MSYHELTEYFVRKVDYQDLESIQLACMLHKETLKETYDLESILQQYEEEAKNIQTTEGLLREILTGWTY